jgi:hypothetical protein
MTKSTIKPYTPEPTIQNPRYKIVDSKILDTRNNEFIPENEPIIIIRAKEVKKVVDFVENNKLILETFFNKLTDEGQLPNMVDHISEYFLNK